MTNREKVKLYKDLVDWHNGNMMVLNQLRQADVTDMVWESSKGEQVPINQDFHKGIQMGIAIAMDIFEEFPVKVNVRKEENKEDGE